MAYVEQPGFGGYGTGFEQPAIIDNGLGYNTVPAGSFVGGGSFVGQEFGGQFGGQYAGGHSFIQGEGVGYEHVRLRVPARQQVRTHYVPGPVINRSIQGPAREVVRRVRVQGPEQIQRVQVQGPSREVVRRVAVQGPERVVTRQVQVQGPAQEVVRRVAVQGPPREVLRRVEVPGAPREVIRRVEVQGPPREQIQTVQVAVPGPPREVVRKVAVPRDVVRQVVKHVNVDQWVDQPVMVQGPGHVRVRFLVDQPPRIVPQPHPVFRTSLVPVVVLVPHTQVGIVPVPRAIPQPPRFAEGPTLPEQAFQQHFGGAQTVGGYEHFGAPFGGPFGHQFGAPAGTFGGFGPAGTFGGYGAPATFGGYGGNVYDPNGFHTTVYDQGLVGGTQVIDGGIVQQGYGDAGYTTTTVIDGGVVQQGF